jgi:hypothetical protein
MFGCRIKLCLFISCLSILIIPLSYSKSFVVGQEVNSGIFSDEPLIYGKSYSEWASKWWQWHISIPGKIHPRENYSPDTCSINQDGPVWFLADGANRKPEERTCTIPFGKAILVQVAGGECDYGEPELNTDEKVKQCVDSGNEGAMVQASVDGKEVMNFQDLRIGHYWFNITVPEDNIYEERAGTYRALVDGWFLFVKPLSLGKHEIHIKGDVTRIGPDGVPTDEDHHTDVLYRLDIKN